MRAVPSRQGVHWPQDSSLGEGQEVAGQIHHAGALVHDDEAAGAHDRPGLACRLLVVDRQVEELDREAATRGTAGLGRLELAAAGDAAADRRATTSPRVIPIGTSMRPGRLTLPGQGEGLRALARRRCRSRRTSRRPRGGCSHTLASVSTLLMFDGWPKRPFTAGNGGRGRGMPRRPSMLAIRAVSSPQTKAPAPCLISMSKENPLPRMSGPSSPSSRIWSSATSRLETASGYSART